MRLALILAITLLIIGCSGRDGGSPAFIETGHGDSDLMLLLAGVQVDTNDPPPEADSPEKPKEKEPDNQDESGESDPDTGDDANPDSVPPGR